jgi:hypothetical protein
LMSKTYLKSDHFNGGGSALAGAFGALNAEHVELALDVTNWGAAFVTYPAQRRAARKSKNANPL